MNRGLFLSILALDSYNRGYGQRINIKGDTSKLGNSTLLSDALDKLNFADVLKADFYAIAYEYQGQTVISYRGTDNLAKDAINGYGVGAGFSGEMSLVLKSAALNKVDARVFGSDFGADAILGQAGPGLGIPSTRLPCDVWPDRRRRRDDRRNVKSAPLARIAPDARKRASNWLI